MTIITMICRLMGNQREYIKSGGFAAYLYENHPDWKPVEINGIKAKVLKLITDKSGCHSGLPTYANTSNMYLRANRDGEVVQAKLYISRKQCIDFDWGHQHKNVNGDGKVFQKGIVHVQRYDASDMTVRHSNNARLMTESEIKKYGAILKAFNPNVKFRP